MEWGWHTKGCTIWQFIFFVCKAFNSQNIFRFNLIHLKNRQNWRKSNGHKVLMSMPSPFRKTIFFSNKFNGFFSFKNGLIHLQSLFIYRGSREVYIITFFTNIHWTFYDYHDIDHDLSRNQSTNFEYHINRCYRIKAFILFHMLLFVGIFIGYIIFHFHNNLHYFHLRFVKK